MEKSYLDYNVIKEDIDKSGLSQREIADLTGIPKSSIQRYLSGNSANVPLDKIVDIAKAVGADPKHWLGWDEEKPPANGGELQLDNKEIINILASLSEEKRKEAISYLRYLRDSKGQE